jgi:hypothetical protein
MPNRTVPAAATGLPYRPRVIPARYVHCGPAADPLPIHVNAGGRFVAHPACEDAATSWTARGTRIAFRPRARGY